MSVWQSRLLATIVISVNLGGVELWSPLSCNYVSPSPMVVVTDDEGSGKAGEGNLLLEDEEWWQRQGDNPRPGTTEVSTCLDTEQLSSAGASTLQEKGPQVSNLVSEIKKVMCLNNLTCLQCKSALMNVIELNSIMLVLVISWVVSLTSKAGEWIVAQNRPSLQQIFWLIIAGKSQMEQITLMTAPLSLSVPYQNDPLAHLCTFLGV